MILPFLNAAGAASGLVALHMSVQVALLVGILLVVDRLLKDRVRASLRHGVWMLVVVKLLLPTQLLSPTAIAYWVAPWIAEPVASSFQTATDVTLPNADRPRIEESVPPEARGFQPTPMSLRPAGWMLLAWVAGSGALMLWVAARNRGVARQVAASTEAPDAVRALLSQTAADLSLRAPRPRLRVTDTAHGPSLCGLFRPVILLPSGLIERLDAESLRQVLRHELIHLSRRDLWWNLLQVGVQVLWWWNPLVWFVNARIRGLRECAVDEAVMLEPGSDDYPATLVAVARHCATPSRMPLAFLGILETRGRLEKRVRRLVERPLPRSARLGWPGWVTVLVAGGMLLPMGFARRIEPSASPTPRNPSPGSTPASTGSDSRSRTAPGEDGPVASTPANASASGTVQKDAAAPKVLIEARFFDVLQSSIPSVVARFKSFTSGPQRRTAPAAQELAKAFENGQSLVKGTTFLLNLLEATELAEAFENAAGTDLLAAPRITTAMNRGSEVSVLSEQQFASDPSPAGNNHPKTALTMKIQTGMTLSVLPGTVPGQPHALELQTVAKSVYADGLVDPLGTSGVVFRTNQTVATARLWDGQTLLLSVGSRTNRVRFIDKVVPFGDLPLLGRLFHTESSQDQVRHLFVLVQPILVDASGKPVNERQSPPLDASGLPREK